MMSCVGVSTDGRRARAGVTAGLTQEEAADYSAAVPVACCSSCRFFIRR